MNRRQCLSILATVAGGAAWTRAVHAQGGESKAVDLLPLYAPDTAVQHKLVVENPARLFKST